MKNLCTKVGKFSCFLEIELTHRGSTFNKARVVVVHTIDIGPNLNFIGTDGGTNERCCVVRPATLEVVDLTIGIATDESLGDVDIVVGILVKKISQAFADVGEVGLTIDI